MDLAVAIVSAGVGVVGTILGVVAKVLPQLRRASHLIDDYFGEPPRPGLPDGRPGVMDRLTTIETQVTVNGGASMKDVVLATRSRVDALADALGSCDTCPAKVPTQHTSP
jgi:hypothetical protein